MSAVPWQKYPWPKYPWQKYSWQKYSWQKYATLTWVLLAFALLPLAGSGRTEVSALPGDHEAVLNWGGVYRKFIAHVPPAYRSGKPLPLVLLFHGAGGSGQEVLNSAGWKQKADQEGFLVAAPDAEYLQPEEPPSDSNLRVWQETPESTDDTIRLRPGAGERTRTDDVKFVGALLDKLEQQYSIDPKRIYAAGISSGGGFTFQLAASLSSRFAACAPVSGLFGGTTAHPQRVMPLIFMIGLDDQVFPFRGGYIMQNGQRVARPSVLSTIAAWARVENFAPRFDVRQQHTDPVVEDGVTILTCGPNNEVPMTVIYLVAGVKHEWPNTKQFNAVHTIWAFFQQQTLP